MTEYTKPARIATTDGIYVLDRCTGFYVPLGEPEPKSSGLWLYIWVTGFIGLAAAIGWGLFGG